MLWPSHSSSPTPVGPIPGRRLYFRPVMLNKSLPVSCRIIMLLCAQGDARSVTGEERGMAFDIPAAIDSFWQAAQRGDYFPPDWYDKLDLDAAYRIQLGLIERRCAEGERQIGWKVGLTAPAIQQQFGFHEPVFGCILHRDESGRVFRPDELIKPGFEPELCLRIGRDLTGSITPEAARGAIDMVYPALEIIETRGPFTEQIAVALADNAQQKTVVLGAGVALPPDLALDRGGGERDDQWRDRRNRTRRRGAGQPGQFRGVACGQAARLWPHAEGGRDHHVRLVHPPVPHCAGRSHSCRVCRGRCGRDFDVALVLRGRRCDRGSLCSQ